MQFLLEQAGDARILRVTVAKLTYIDSATIGCLVEIHRLLEDLGGSLTLTGLHRRVETMLSMTGVLQFLNVDGRATSSFDSWNYRGLSPIGQIGLSC